MKLITFSNLTTSAKLDIAHEKKIHSEKRRNLLIILLLVKLSRTPEIKEKLNFMSDYPANSNDGIHLQQQQQHYESHCEALVATTKEFYYFFYFWSNTNKSHINRKEIKWGNRWYNLYCSTTSHCWVIIVLLNDVMISCLARFEQFVSVAF